MEEMPFANIVVEMDGIYFAVTKCALQNLFKAINQLDVLKFIGGIQLSNI